MKIGILTYHKSHNYGAVLQAIALRLILQKMGHSVFYIDYLPNYIYYWYSQSSFYNALKDAIHRKDVKILYKSLISSKAQNKRYYNFVRFINSYITPYCLSSSEDYDIIIYGSDQIWRKQPDTGKYDAIYFGKNTIKTKKHISYAASMGVLPNNENDVKKLIEFCSYLDNISVREEDLQQMLFNNGIKNVKLVLDPTLLLEKEEWMSYLPNHDSQNNNKYVLFYDLLPNSFNKEEIKNFAINNNWELITLSGVVDGREKKNLLFSAGPEEFVNLIRNAEFIFTSSYHGLLFSIIFEKNFLASFGRNSERAESILKKLDLRERLLSPMGGIPNHVEKIDYNQIKRKISDMKQQSLFFLMESLQ